jgi:hypothetical protein
MLVLGQVTPVTSAFPYGDLVLHGGALGVLSWAVWHAYKTVIPDMKKDLREDRARYMTSIQSSAESFKETLDAMGTRHERMETATNDRHERWEKQRHDDSEGLQAAISELAVTCEGTRTRLSQIRKENMTDDEAGV